jgi:hypothetical protein
VYVITIENKKRRKEKKKYLTLTVDRREILPGPSRANENKKENKNITEKLYHSYYFETYQKACTVH